MELKHTEEFMKRAVSENRFDTYAILVGLKGQTKLLTSPNADADTYFDIASMGKIFVTTPLILKAVGDKKLSLDDTLDMFFDNVPADKKKITVKQLLTHTAGIHEDFIPKFTCDRGKDAVIASILNHGLDYQPGTSYIYSSHGMMLAGYIVEKVYDMPLDGAFYAYMAAPMGYKRSRFNIDIEEKNAAITYCRPQVGENRASDRNVYSLKNCVSGAGGEYSCVNDLQKFAIAVLEKDERLYSSYLFDLAEQDYTPSFSEGRGLGYILADKRVPQAALEPDMVTEGLFPAGSFGHCGYTGTSIFIHRESGLYVIILTNATRFAYMKNNYVDADYEDIKALRAEIHTEIKKDLIEQGLRPVACK